MGLTSSTKSIWCGEAKDSGRRRSGASDEDPFIPMRGADDALGSFGDENRRGGECVTGRAYRRRLWGRPVTL